MAFALHFFGSAMAEHGWTVESQETLYETDDTHFLSVGVACISRFFWHRASISACQFADKESVTSTAKTFMAMALSDKLAETWLLLFLPVLCFHLASPLHSLSTQQPVLHVLGPCLDRTKSQVLLNGSLLL